MPYVQQAFGFSSGAVCCLLFSIEVWCSFVADFLFMGWGVVVNGSKCMCCICLQVREDGVSYAGFWIRWKCSLLFVI